MWGMVCGRKRPLGIEKSDDHGRHESTDCLWVTKLSIPCACDYNTHIADAGSRNDCRLCVCICINTALFVLYMCTLYLMVRLGVAFWYPAHLSGCSVSAQWQMTGVHRCEQEVQNVQLNEVWWEANFHLEWVIRIENNLYLNMCAVSFWGSYSFSDWVKR